MILWSPKIGYTTITNILQISVQKVRARTRGPYSKSLALRLVPWGRGFFWEILGVSVLVEDPQFCGRRVQSPGVLAVSGLGLWTHTIDYHSHHFCRFLI